MENIYIKIDEIPRSLAEKYFISKDLVSLDELIAEFDNLYYEYCYLKDEYEEFKEDVEQNYKYIDERERIGYDETW